MLGLPGRARMLYQDMYRDRRRTCGGMLPADADGATLPPAGAPAPIVEVDDQDGSGFPEDRLSVWNATSTGAELRR